METELQRQGNQIMSTFNLKNIAAFQKNFAKGTFTFRPILVWELRPLILTSNSLHEVFNLLFVQLLLLVTFIFHVKIKVSPLYAESFW